MKKYLSIILAVLVLAVALVSCFGGGQTTTTQPTPITPPTDVSKGLEFTLNDDEQSYSVTGIGSCADTDIVIPSTYNDLPVTGIGREAFYYCTSLTSVEIPDSVTSIGEYAFLWCTSLTSVEIPDSVTSIGIDAFFLCYALQYNEYDNGLYLGNENNPYHALICVTDSDITSLQINSDTRTVASGMNSWKLTGIEVDENNEYYKSIDGNLYSKDGATLVLYLRGKQDTSFTIPNSVTSIGNYAFRDCDSLTSVTIPNSVTSIGSRAFRYCTSLTSIEIPDSVTSIGYEAFYYCTSLTSIKVDENNEYYKSIDEHLYSKDGKTLIQYAIGKQDTSFTIPDTVTSIGEGAFLYCESLTSVEIPNSVTSIGEDAFCNCTSLTSVTIPDSVTSIGYEAFYYCTSLTSVMIPDAVTSIGKYAFYGCDSLTSVKVDANNEYYKSIDGNLYSKDGATLVQYAVGKTNTSFTIPDSVTSIDNYAFRNCTSLTSIEFGENSQLTSIGDGAFSSCKSLTSITIPDSVTSIGEYAFWCCTSLTSIEIPDSVTSIGLCAFWQCDSLTSITFEGTVEQWNAIEFGNSWNYNVPATEVICSDGTVTLE